MTATDPVDEARLDLLLGELRPPGIKHIWSRFAERADKEGWPAARFLAALAEHELAERALRRIERHLTEARLPPGKTLDSFDFDAVPMVSKAQVMALVASSTSAMMSATSARRRRWRAPMVTPGRRHRDLPQARRSQA